MLFGVNQIRQKTLFIAPTKKELKSQLIATLRAESHHQENAPTGSASWLRLISHLEVKDADTVWMQNMLSTLDYNDRLPMFTPPLQKHQWPQQQQPQPCNNGGAERKLVDLPSNVVDAVRRMPMSSSKGAGLSLSLLMTPFEREQEKMRRLEQAEAKLRERREKQEVALEKARNPQPQQVNMKMNAEQHAQFLAFLQQQERKKPGVKLGERLDEVFPADKNQSAVNMLGERHNRRQQQAKEQPARVGDQEMKLM